MLSDRPVQSSNTANNHSLKENVDVMTARIHC